MYRHEDSRSRIRFLKSVSDTADKRVRNRGHPFPDCTALEALSQAMAKVERVLDSQLARGVHAAINDGKVGSVFIVEAGLDALSRWRGPLLACSIPKDLQLSIVAAVRSNAP